MDIKFKKVVVLLTDAADKVLLQTDMPCPFVPEFIPSQPPLDLEFQATRDTGIEYCRKHLGVEPEVVNIRRGQ